MATGFKRGGKSNRHSNWYVQWFDHTGKCRVKCTRTPDRTAALRIAAKLETSVALRREGVVDAQQESYSVEARKPLTAHIDAYDSKLEVSGRSEVHATETCKAIRKIAGVRAFKQLATTGSSLGIPWRACTSRVQRMTAGTNGECCCRTNSRI